MDVEQSEKSQGKCYGVVIIGENVLPISGRICSVSGFQPHLDKTQIYDKIARVNLESVACTDVFWFISNLHF